LKSFIPSVRLCSDNAAMVGALAFEKAGELVLSGLDLDAYPRK
jgi:N6-L-threonylcarbamoyladenine synthase